MCIRDSITTMSRNIIWASLFFFREAFKQITIIYHKPNSYSDTCLLYTSKPSKVTEFLDTLRKAIAEESKKKGYL